MQQQESKVQCEQEEQHLLVASPQQAENSTALGLLMTPPMPQTISAHRQITFEDSIDNFGLLSRQTPSSFLELQQHLSQEGASLQHDLRRIVPSSSNDNDQYALQYFCSPEPNTFNAVDYSPPALQQLPRKSVGQPRTGRLIGKPNSSPKSATQDDANSKAMVECTCSDLQDSSCQHLQCHRRRHMEANLYQKIDSHQSNPSSKVDSLDQMLFSLQRQKVLCFSSSSGDGKRNITDSPSLENNEIHVSMPGWLLKEGQDEMYQCQDSQIKTPQSVSAQEDNQWLQEVEQDGQKGVQRFQSSDESGYLLLKGVLSPKLSFCHSNLSLPRSNKLASDFEMRKKSTEYVNFGEEEEEEDSTMTTSCNDAVAAAAVNIVSKGIEAQRKEMTAASLPKNMAIDFNPVSSPKNNNTTLPGAHEQPEVGGIAQKSHEKPKSTIIAPMAKSTKKVSNKKNKQRNLFTPAATNPKERVLNFYSGHQPAQQLLQFGIESCGVTSSKKQSPDFVINDSTISSAVTRPHYFDHLPRNFDQQLLSAAASSSAGQHHQHKHDEIAGLLDFDQNSENTSQLNNEALLRPFNVDSIQLKKPLGVKPAEKTNVAGLSCSNETTSLETKIKENHWHKAEKAISEISKNSSDDEDDDDQDQSNVTGFDIDESCSQSLRVTAKAAPSHGPQSQQLHDLAAMEMAQLATLETQQSNETGESRKEKRCGVAATFEQAMKSRMSWQSQQEEGGATTRTMQMDRFIPCRTQEAVQAKFEAASQNQQDFWQKEGLSLNGARQQQQQQQSIQQLRPRQHTTATVISQQATTTTTTSPASVQTSNASAVIQPSSQASSAARILHGYHAPRQLSQVSSLAALSTQSQASAAAGLLIPPESPLLLSQQHSGSMGRSSLLPESSSLGLSIRRLEPVIHTQHSLSSSLSPLGGPVAVAGASASTSGGRAPPLENSSPFLKPANKANSSSEKLKSYNYLLEKSIFYESQAEQGAAQQTNLTTDIDKDASLIQGLSLVYQTSCKAAARQTTSPSRRHQSAVSHEHQMDDSMFMKENQTQTSCLQASKILTFKKSLSMNGASAVQKDPTVAILGETTNHLRKSIVAEYSSSCSLLDSPRQTRQRNNPLSSMDYLTAETTTTNQRRHQGASSAGSYTRGGAANPDNIIVSKVRKIATQAYKILDAPSLCDDFYLNLVDWSSTNILAVALGQCVFIWNANTSRVTQLVDLGERSRVTSVSWSQKGTHLCVGTHNGQVQVWDVLKQRCVRIMSGHDLRVSACAWSGSLVASGSKDKSILVRDVRAQSNFHQRLTSHRQEVCGLRWSPHDEQMLASGGNDNKLMIWNVAQNRSSEPLARFDQHQAAVKAINWSPLHRGLLATGGGTADQHIRFWNTINLQPISAVNTGSQVCNLIFSKTNDELVSTHGYSLNQVIVWKCPTMEKIATLTGHTYRVLYLAMSPDGSSIVTGAGDETLRFWNIFPKSRSSRGAICGNDIVGSGSSQLFPSGVDFR